MQGIKGLVGQTMSGQRKSRTPLVYELPPGTTTFRPAVSGSYRIVLRGAGGSAGTGTVAAGSGAYVEAIRYLSGGLTYVVNVAESPLDSVSDPPAATSFTHPMGVLSAGCGYPSAHASTPRIGGTAIGNLSLGDVLIDGSLGASGAVNGNPGGGNAGGLGGALSGLTPGGTGAPGNNGHRGAKGRDAFIQTSGGAAHGAPGGNTGDRPGGGGVIMIEQVRLRP